MTRLTQVTITTVAMAMMVAGCSTGTSATPAPDCLGAHDGVVVVVGVHANAATVDPARFRCPVGEALVQQHKVSVVSVEGKPRVLVDGAHVGGVINSDGYLRARATQTRASIERQVKAAVPASDGADLVAALAVAADASRAAGMKHPLIVVSDPGLSDRGAINFTTPGMSVADPGDVAAQVKSDGQCPALAGVDVTLTGLGYGVSPQLPLTPADRGAVSTTWSALVTTCGGRATVVPAPTDGHGPTTRYTVTTVQPSAYRVPDLASPVTYPGNSPLGFVTDKTVFVHDDQAVTVLGAIADQMKKNPSWHLTITGTTANGDTVWPSLTALGQARADTVAGRLVGLGVARDRITTVGYGYTARPKQIDAATAALNRSTTFSYSRG